jgi:phage gpG-like protein
MSKFRFDQKANAFKTQKAGLLQKMANDAINYFKIDVFDSKSFNGSPWAPNKVTDGRQQLVKTGRLRQSIRVLKRTNNSITVGSSVPYAKYHNEGTKNLPKRQFIGDAVKLKSLHRRDIDEYLRRVGKRARI